MTINGVLLGTRKVRLLLDLMTALIPLYDSSSCLAIGSLRRHPTRIKSREEVLKLNGVSDKTADKVGGPYFKPQHL